eukprot:3488586-Rhodomonas_salina.1
MPLGCRSCRLLRATARTSRAAPLPQFLRKNCSDPPARCFRLGDGVLLLRESTASCPHHAPACLPACSLSPYLSSPLPPAG